MSKKAAQLAEQMAQMLEVIGVLEARLTELKKMAKRGSRQGVRKGSQGQLTAEKPKRPPTAWIQFTQRVRGVLAGAGQPFPRAADLMKFCKDLRAQKGDGCTDAQLLEARTGWEPPTAVATVAATDAVPVCPTCTGDISEDPEKHRACVRSVAAAAQAAGADPMKAVDAWSEAVQSKPRAVAVAAGSRARTPLRRPSAPVHFSSLVAAEAAPGAALNTPSEEMVVEDI